MSLRRWAGDDDRVVDQALKPTGAIVWPTLDAWSTAVRKAGTEVDDRKYKDLGHGVGPGTGTRAEG